MTVFEPEPAFTDVVADVSMMVNVLPPEPRFTFRPLSKEYWIEPPIPNPVTLEVDNVPLWPELAVPSATVNVPELTFNVLVMPDSGLVVPLPTVIVEPEFAVIVVGILSPLTLKVSFPPSPFTCSDVNPEYEIEIPPNEMAEDERVKASLPPVPFT